jgi:hypothetical protein
MINNCCNLQRVAAQLPLEFIGGLEGIAVYDQQQHIIGREEINVFMIS